MPQYNMHIVGPEICKQCQQVKCLKAISRDYSIGQWFPTRGP